jgi:myo-inositol-1(or 4)-monophosphatase
VTKKEIEDLSLHLVGVAQNAALQVADMLVVASAEARAGHVSIAEKASFHDLVTKYDHESEQIISDYILQHHLDSMIMGEEYGAKGDGSVRWYVDPIDGTSNFAAGIPFFCVSIGAVCDDRMMAGVIYDPIRQELFSASTQGAFLNGQPIRSHGHQTDSQSLLITAFPTPHTNPSDDEFLFFANIVRSFATVRRMGSAALSLAYVACGRADIMYEPGVNPWDITAGLFLVQQAGGKFVTFGRPKENASPAKPWLYPQCIAMCPEFELERSVMNTFLNS